MGGTCTLVILLCTNRMYLPVVCIELHSTVHNTVHSHLTILKSYTKMSVMSWKGSSSVMTNTDHISRSLVIKTSILVKNALRTSGSSIIYLLVIEEWSFVRVDTILRVYRYDPFTLLLDIINIVMPRVTIPDWLIWCPNLCYSVVSPSLEITWSIQGVF